MHMRRDEARLYREEADIRPNRYCARAMCLIAVVAMLILIINELGMFRVDKTVMRIGIGVALTALSVLQTTVINDYWASWPGTKFVIVGSISVVALIVDIMLQFHATFFLLLPLLIASLYPSRKTGWFALIFTEAGILLSPLLSLILGTWSNGFTEFLLETSMRSTLQVITQEELSLQVLLARVFAYICFPRLMIGAAFGAVVLSINRRNEERIKATVQVLHMSESDALTELHNRRSYEKHLPAFPEGCRSCVSCVYLDANGLHNLNKQKGHAAGDAMLCCVAEALRSQFGDEDTYRIGGDEFVALAADLSLEELRRRIQTIQSTVEKAGYSVAAGLELNSLPCTMAPLVRSAEAKMFSDKIRMYRENGSARSGGETNAEVCTGH